jgi:hypothetical protein
VLALLLATVVLGTAGIPARAQTVPDSTFDTAIARPAFVTHHPRVAFDEAHHNTHTPQERYGALAQLWLHDGCTISSAHKAFTSANLKNCNLLVIADALGSNADDSTAALPAFGKQERAALHDWVRAGGALLLISDQAPIATSMASLATEFGVTLAKGLAIDPAHGDPETGNPGAVLFTRANGMLADHAITRGRDSTERVNRIMTWTGQSLFGPHGSVPLFMFGHGAREYASDAGARAVMVGGAPGAFDPADAVSISGRAQGLAFEFGHGRVVVLGDAALFTAGVSYGRAAQALGHPIRTGMNRDDTDNRQFALNTLHWLARLLP